MATVNSYKDKYMGVDGRLSVMEILQKVGTTEYREGEIKEYEAVDISEVIIDGNRFRNYGAYSFIWEKTFVKSPERSGSGSLGNLNSYATFLTPHLIMDFSVMSIDDYRKIMLLHYGANEFTVECYDPIYNRKIKVKMYFSTEEMAKLYTISQNRLLPNGQWEEWVDLVGVTEYKVELIGTNNDLDLVSVRYKYNSINTPTGSPMPDQYEEDVYLGEEITIGSNSTFPENPPSGMKFSHWEDEEGVRYNNGRIFTVNAPLTLYAVWQSSKTFILSYNYGLSKVALKVNSGTGIATEILNTEITNVNNIGYLPPITPNPSVKYGNDNTDYYPYENGAWYKHPIKQEDIKVVDNQPYWTGRDTIIYALYDKKTFTVEYETNNPKTYVPTQNCYYGDQVYLPTLSAEGYTFEGWYIDEEFKTEFSGTMPPYSITLYARWTVSS